MQSVILRHRTLEPTSHRLELSIQGERCRATIRRLVEQGPIVAEFPLSGLSAISDLTVGDSRKLGCLRFERLSDVFRLRYVEGSRERECLFVGCEELGLALLRLHREASPRPAT